MIILDSSAWIEFFIKSNLGSRVKKILEDERCCTSIVSMAEISNWALKNERDCAELLNYVKNLSEIIQVTEEIAFLAGELNYQRKRTISKWGMMDSFVLATAQIYSLKIITKDRQFKDLPDTELL